MKKQSTKFKVASVKKVGSKPSWGPSAALFGLERLGTPRTLIAKQLSIRVADIDRLKRKEVELTTSGELILGQMLEQVIKMHDNVVGGLDLLRCNIIEAQLLLEKHYLELNHQQQNA